MFHRLAFLLLLVSSQLQANLITVTTINDELDAISNNGTGISLREAIRDISPEGTIIFAESLIGGTIQLDSNLGELSINKSIEIDLSALTNELRIEGVVRVTNSINLDFSASTTTDRRNLIFSELDVTAFSGTMKIQDRIRFDLDSNLVFANGGSLELITPARLDVDQLFVFQEGKLSDSLNGIVAPGFYFEESLEALGENYISDAGVIVISNRFGDSDSDGLPDFFEDFIIAFKPNDNIDSLEDVAGPNDSFTTDFDNDGLSDADEFLNGPSNPAVQDTDTDGLLDGPEVSGTNNEGQSTGFGPTDPLLNDTDDDGYDDNLEILAGNNPAAPNDLPINFPIRAEGITPVFEDERFTRVSITFSGLNTKRSYRLVRGSNLESFPDIVRNSFSPGRSTTTTSDFNPPTETDTKAFYRLLLIPEGN